MDGTARFNKAFYPDFTGAARETVHRATASAQWWVRGRNKVFISHKTNDLEAERLAKYITRVYRVVTYLAEWDPYVRDDSPTLPDYIMDHIQSSHGFLVSVIPEITFSMWVGYEIGGAHAHQVPRAKIMFSPVSGMPSVVEALESLRNSSELDSWIRREVLKADHG